MLINNNNNGKIASVLPLMALDNIPAPNAGAKSIVALVKENGRVTGYKLSDGNIVDKQQGVNLAKQGEIQGVGVAHRNDTEYLKSIPDGTESNNLSNLPSISGKL
jgi:hypothetical protein